jgi:hypothetical protein
MKSLTGTSGPSRVRNNENDNRRTVGDIKGTGINAHHRTFQKRASQTRELIIVKHIMK